MPALELALAWLRRHPLLVGSLVLAGWYTATYLGYYARPGNSVQYPLGWWGWWDQSNYLKSAVALAHLDLRASEHLYPLGYSLLGALFVPVSPVHPFYIVDLIALMVTLAAFASFARRCGIAPLWSTLLFVLAVAADPVLFEQWVVPWNTSAISAALWVLLAVAAAHMAGQRRPCWLGLAAVCVPMLRPSDLLLTLPALGGCLLMDLRHRRLRWRDLAGFAVAALGPAVIYGALHVRTYGWHESEYMRVAGALGFTLHGLGWKAYIILVDPRPWIGGGKGLIARVPWLILGIAGLITALRRPIPAMLAVSLLAHSILYLSFLDLLPTGFWRYLNVHYWTWAFPGFALLGAGLVADLWGRHPLPRRGVAAGALVLVLLLLCIRLIPKPLRDADPSPATALDYAEPMPPFDATYFGPLQVHDPLGTMANITDVRSIPMPKGVRVLTLRRDIQEPFTVTGEGLDHLTPTRLHTALGFGIPFWPWTKADEFYGPR